MRVEPGEGTVDIVLGVVRLRLEPRLALELVGRGQAPVLYPTPGGLVEFARLHLRGCRLSLADLEGREAFAVDLTPAEVRRLWDLAFWLA